MKIEVTSRWDSASVLLSTEAESLRAAVEVAVSSGADLRGADLYGADLYGANLRGANLYGADLYGADLRGADLRGADLRGADLRGADLYGADLHGADLRGADLRGADLRGADLYGADLYGADLRGAEGVTPQVLQIAGTRHPLIVREYGIVQIGCHAKKLEWWEKHYESIGKTEGYSENEVAEYGEHIASARKFMERYALLEAPKEVARAQD